MHVDPACFLMVTAVVLCYCGNISSQTVRNDAVDSPLQDLSVLRKPSLPRLLRRTCTQCPNIPSFHQGSDQPRVFHPSHTRMIDITPPVKDSSQRNPEKVAVLTVDHYNGKETLVYKLAPGAIFKGVRTRAIETDSNIFNKPDMNYFSGNNLNNKGSSVLKHRGNMYGGGVHPPFSQRKNRNHLKGTTDPLNSSHTKWKVHYLHPKPPLSAMSNPYLPSKAERRVRSRTSNRIKLETVPDPVNAAGSTSGLMYPIAKAFQLARAKTRGAWISFLLLHYLGFLPYVPGMPKHKDPLDTMASISYS